MAKGRHSAGHGPEEPRPEAARRPAPEKHPAPEKRSAPPRRAPAVKQRGEWDLGPSSRPWYRALRWVLRAGLCAAFVAVVCWVWPSRPNGAAVSAATPAPEEYSAAAEQILTLDGRTLHAFAAPDLATPTPKPVWTFTAPDLTVPAASVSPEEKKELDAAVQSDNGETVYTSANDYFGSDDVLLTFYDILEDATPTPAPTATPAPTPAPTAVPTDTPAATLPDGSTPTPAPATEAPTQPPTAAPTQAPAGALVLTGSGSAPCVLAYNNWSTELKQYTYQQAKAYGISYELVLAIIYHESGFNASATHLNTNGTTDWGLMQINDVCFTLLNRQLGISGMGDLLDPYKGIQAGCAILAYHLRYVGNENDALLRYQVGAGSYAYYKANGTVPRSYTNTIAMRQSFYDAGV